MNKNKTTALPMACLLIESGTKYFFVVAVVPTLSEGGQMRKREKELHNNNLLHFGVDHA